MSVQSIHSRKRLLASLTSVWSEVEMERFVALAVVLTSEALFTARPLALERSFFVVGAEMTYEID